VIPAAIVVFVGLPSLYALIYWGNKWGLGGLITMALVIAGLLLWQRDTWPEVGRLFREGANYFKGAQGEFRVHQELKQLSDEYVVFHDFHPVDPTTGKPSRWNVDHIVVGPTGVFVLDATYYGQKRVQSAERNQYSARNVRQVRRNAIELQQRLARWSAGQLKDLFVVAAVVYVQPDAWVERPREGATRTIPLRLLRREITSHTEAVIDQEKAGRIARVLFSQIPGDLQAKFKPEFDAYGELSRAARYAARDARLASQAEDAVPAKPTPTVPTVCPECGGKLVRRVAHTGARAGKPFLGCENFRAAGCKYGFNLEE
jgi:hypothetical protein